MSYDPSGPGLFPEDRLDEPSSGSSWRRGAGTAGASLGDLVAADPKRHVFMSGRMAFGQQSIYRPDVCVTCGKPERNHRKWVRHG